VGQGSVFKRGRTWWIEYSVSGMRYRESAKTTRRENAETLLRTRQQQLWEGTFVPGARKSKPLTIGGLRDLWLRERKGKASLSDDKQRLGVFVERFDEHRMVATLTTDEIRDWRDELAEKLEPATVNRYLAVVRSALNLADTSGHQHRDPMAGITFGGEDNARDRLCSPEEYRRLIEAAQGDLGACITVGYWTGMRLGEIVNLTRDRLDLDAGMLRLSASATKEATAKSVPLPADAVSALRSIPSRIDGRVFRCNRDWYSRKFGELAKSLEIKDLHFHDLRHTALTRMADAGVDIMTMAAISGHKTLEMLKRYVHRREVALRAAMDRVEAHAQAANKARS
jgi:integrase